MAGLKKPVTWTHSQKYYARDNAHSMIVAALIIPYTYLSLTTTQNRKNKVKIRLHCCCCEQSENMATYHKNRLAVLIEPDPPPSPTSATAKMPGVDEVDFVRLRRPKHHANHNNLIRQSAQFFQKRLRPASEAMVTLGSGLLSFLTLKVLFWDLVICIGDLVSDLAQGIALLTTEDRAVYGIITIGINWVPGAAASIHLLSMYRHELPWQKTLLYAALLLVFYPIVPTLAFINLLWKKPRSSNDPVTPEFREAEARTVIAHAITGGLESPIQLIYQVWLVLNGLVDLDWNAVSSLTFTDWEGNTIYLPFTSSLCIVFSVISILKATMEFNVMRMHVAEVSSWSKSFTCFRLYTNHVAFLASAAFFRCASIIAIVTYLNTYGLLPILIFWILSFVINQRLFGPVADRFPKWLVSFMSVFVPVCFAAKINNNNDNSKRKDDVGLQYRTFKWQAWAAFISYTSPMIVVILFVNMPFDFSGWKYNPDIILNNQEFNVYAATILVMGSISTILSLSPDSSRIRCKDDLDAIEEVMANENSNLLNNNKSNKKRIGTSGSGGLKFVKSILVIVVTILPLVIARIFLLEVMSDYSRPAFVYYNPGMNETVIIQATPVVPFRGRLEGFLRHIHSNQEIKKRAFEEQIGGRQFNAPTAILDDEVILISRSSWDEKKEQILTSQPLAVIILDNQGFRPSSPLPDFRLTRFLELDSQEKEVPVLLVRQEDTGWFDVFEDNILPVWIAPSNMSVADPHWECDWPPGSCLAATFANGYISGRQYRTKACHWGGHPCKG